MTWNFPRLAVVSILFVSGLFGCASPKGPESAIVATAAKVCPDFFEKKPPSEWVVVSYGTYWKVEPRDGTSIWVEVQKAGTTTSKDCLLLVQD